MRSWRKSQASEEAKHSATDSSKVNLAPDKTHILTYVQTVVPPSRTATSNKQPSLGGPPRRKLGQSKIVSASAVHPSKIFDTTDSNAKDQPSTAHRSKRPDV